MRRVVRRTIHCKREPWKRSIEWGSVQQLYRTLLDAGEVWAITIMACRVQ